MSKKIGYIGLGVLGSAMVPNLIKSGFEVIGYDVRPEVLEELGKLGMTVACSPKDTAERSDVVITCLPTIKVLLDVFGGDDGIDKADKADQIVIETSTFPVDAKEKAKAFMEAAGKRCSTVRSAAIVSWLSKNN